jgi:hypothetical protein
MKTWQIIDLIALGTATGVLVGALLGPPRTAARYAAWQPGTPTSWSSAPRRSATGPPSRSCATPTPPARAAPAPSTRRRSARTAAPPPS